MSKASGSSYSLSSLPVKIRLKIEAVCERFEKLLQAKKTPHIEQFLEKYADLPRRHLLRELLVQEVQYLSQKGDEPEISTYLKRFPNGFLYLFKRWHRDSYLCGCSEFTQFPVNTSILNKEKPPN